MLYQLDIESIRLKKCQVGLVETDAMSTRLRQAQADSMISMSNWYSIPANINQHTSFISQIKNPPYSGFLSIIIYLLFFYQL